MKLRLSLLIATTLLSMTMSTQAAPLGEIVRYDAALDEIVPQDWRIEKLAEGFQWSEGPVWMKAGGYLLFDDVPGNTMYRWSEKEGLSVFLKPSGYAGTQPELFAEPGANGLFPDGDDTILMADHGNRMIARLNVKAKQKTPLATHFEGKRFNSPNDVIKRKDGVIFFTDPPYGLKGRNDSPIKELPYNGIYRIDLDGSIHLLDKEMTFPNGLALSPDERTLIVANSDPKKPIWMAFTLDARGDVVEKRVFADASDLIAKYQGLPDGLRITGDGTVFTTAPGGVLVLDSAGKRLGLIRTGSRIANCAFGDADGKSLYMTSDKFLARIRLKVDGSR